MKIWSWAIQFANNKVWEYNSPPSELELDEDFVESVKFSGRSVIEFVVADPRSVIYLFNSRESAITFMEGYKIGHSTGVNGVEFWQTKLDQIIDAGLDGIDV